MPKLQVTADRCLDTEILDTARNSDINFSQVCDDSWRESVESLEFAGRWHMEHADFITAYNTTIETDGLPLDEWRTF